MFTIKNIKISLRISTIPLNTALSHLEENGIKYTIKSNYIVIRLVYVYIIFMSKNQTISHVNVTKIRGFNDLDDVEKVFKDMIFNFSGLNICQRQIDNITSVYNSGVKIILQSLLSNESLHHKIVYNREKFPGLFLKNSIGTMIIFHTGKIIAVGVKKEEDLDCLFNLVKLILQNGHVQA